MASVTDSSTPRNLLTAAIYVRVSSTTQEAEGTSLQTQEERCRAYARERGYTFDDAHLYREVFTGVELWERPQLTQLPQFHERTSFG